MVLRWVGTVTLLIAGITAPLATFAQPADGGDPRVPSVLDTPVEFTGPRTSSSERLDPDEIRIGLFGPADAPADENGAMWHGALLAAEEVNDAGGVDGKPLRLISRWSGDPWRGGAKDMVRLVYEDQVTAVIGSINGDATHVAEQVITKARVPLLSPISADPTLTYIRIPWVFRLPPNDERQAEALITEARRALSAVRFGLVTSTHHDDRIFATAALAQLKAAGLAPAFHLQVPAKGLDPREIVRRLTDFSTDAIILRLSATDLNAVIEALRAAGLHVPLLIPWIPDLAYDRLAELYSGPILLLRPFEQTSNAEFDGFVRRFDARFGMSPSAGAAYSYDAVHLIAGALRSKSHGRADLRDALAAASGTLGVTGEFLWDNGLGNVAEPGVEWVRGPRVR